MTFRELFAIRILFVIAKWIAPSEWHKEIEALGVHLSVNVPKAS